MKKILLLGDSISLHYRKALFEMCKGVVSFEPNWAETGWINAQADPQAAAKEVFNSDFSDYNMDKPDRLNCGDSFRMLEKLETYLGQQLFGADLVLLNCGLHDQKKSWEDHTHQVELAQYQKNLLAMISLAGREKLCWVTTTPVVDGRHDRSGFNRLEADHAAYLEAANRIMADAGVPMIDLCSFTGNLEKENRYRDHVHFSEEVVRQQAAFIAGNLFRL